MSPYNIMNSAADRQRQILIASFAFELKIELSLVGAAHALDKGDRKTIYVLEVGTPRYSNLSQLSTGLPFAKRTCLITRGASPWFCCGLLVDRFRRERSQADEAYIQRRQLIRPEDRYHQHMLERRYG